MNMNVDIPYTHARRTYTRFLCTILHARTRSKSVIRVRAVGTLVELHLPPPFLTSTLPLRVLNSVYLLAGTYE